MKQYEYTIERMMGALDETVLFLNQKGSQGWELVTVINLNCNLYGCFKKEI